MMRIFHVVCVTDDDRLRAYEVQAPANATNEALLALVRRDETFVKLTRVERLILRPMHPGVLRQLPYIP